MIVEFKTAIHHANNEDGSERKDHCCGCWHFCLDEDAPQKPYARCNECGEIRIAIFKGIP